MNVQDKVRQGALLLDFVKPDWAFGLDPDDLDMASVNYDIVALTSKPVPMSYEQDHYDQLLQLGLIAGEEIEYDELTAIWRYEIDQRVRSAV